MWRSRTQSEGAQRAQARQPPPKARPPMAAITVLEVFDVVETDCAIFRNRWRPLGFLSDRSPLCRRLWQSILSLRRERDDFVVVIDFPSEHGLILEKFTAQRVHATGPVKRDCADSVALFVNNRVISHNVLLSSALRHCLEP